MSGSPARALVGLGVVMALIGCDEPVATNDADDEATDDAGEPAAIEWQPPAGTSLRYVSQWDWTGAEQATTGEWVFETDLGVRVGIELGYLATATLMLVPCEDDEAEADDSSLRAHSTVSDSSLLIGPFVESFTDDPLERELGISEASGATYCALHWLAAPVEQAASDGFMLDQTSVEVHGWYEGASGERHTFAATVPLSAGGLRPLHALDLERTTGDPSTIRLIRRPARALDGVEIEALSPSELAFELVQGLAIESTVWVED